MKITIIFKIQVQNHSIMGCSILPITSNKTQTFTLKSQLQFIQSLSPGKIFAQTQGNSYPIIYFLRDFQINLQNQRDFKQALQQFDKDIISKDIDFCKLVQIDTLQNSMGFCGTTTRITVLYQHYSVTLQDEIIARQGMNNKYFQLEDLWSLLQGLLTAMEYLQNIPIQVKDQMQKLRILSLLHAHPNHILVTPEGQIKIMNPFEYSFEERFIRSNKAYYSPQKILDFTLIQDAKSTLFQLGLTILSTALLKDCSDIYDGYDIDQQLLANRLQKVWSVYQDYWFSTILNNLLQIKRCKRLQTNQLLKLVHQGMQQFQQNSKKSKRNSGILPTLSELKENNQQSFQDSCLKEWLKENRKQSMPTLNAQIVNSIYPSNTNSYTNSNRNSLSHVHDRNQPPFIKLENLHPNTQTYTQLQKNLQNQSPKNFIEKNNDQNRRTMQTSNSNPRSVQFFTTASFSKKENSKYKKNQIKCNYQIGNFSQNQGIVIEGNLKKQRSEVSFKNLEIFTQINIDIYDNNMKSNLRRSQKQLKKSMRNSEALEPKIMKIV